MRISDETVRAALTAYCGPNLYTPEDSMRAALEAALAAMWRPIEEAPKDGTPIFGYWMSITGADAQNAGRAFGVVIWERSTWCNPDDTDDDYRDPSMWMPLPSPPNISARSSAGSEQPAERAAPVATFSPLRRRHE